MARARLLDTAERSETADHNPAQQNRVLLASSHLSIPGLFVSPQSGGPAASERGLGGAP